MNKSGENPVEFVHILTKRVITVYREIDIRIFGQSLSKNHPKSAPAINKPLVKWKWNYSYISSMHMLIPGYLNRFYREDKASVTGCLLHFKFISLRNKRLRRNSKGRAL